MKKLDPEIIFKTYQLKIDTHNPKYNLFLDKWHVLDSGDTCWTSNREEAIFFLSRVVLDLTETSVFAW